MSNFIENGWNTWASSLPKDYLLKYIIEAGDNQVVIIDDLLPLQYRNRNKEEQKRVTDLYVFLLNILLIY